MVGHSVGEFVAATLAGVMSLEDALGLIARRGQLISSLPAGAMLSVMAPPETLEPFIRRGVSLAAMNAPGFAVLSGPTGEIERVEAALAHRSIAARRLHTSHAFHSSMMDPILAEFEQLVERVRLSTPQIPFVTTLTGEWADERVTQPAYWSAQVRSTVRFADAVRALGHRASPVRDPVFLEVGPGNTLVTFASEAAKMEGRQSLGVACLKGPHDARSDTDVMLTSLGQLWATGVDIDWDGFHRNERRARVSLPTYPFERRSYWIGPRPCESLEPVHHEPRDTSNWFYRPTWTAAPQVDASVSVLAGRRIVVFDEQSGLGSRVVERLRALGARPIVVTHGRTFTRTADDAYAVNPSEPLDFKALAAKVCSVEPRLAGVVDCWSAAPPGQTDLDAAATTTLLAPMRLAHALSSQPTVRPLPMLLVARGTTRVHPGDVIDPPRALGAGAAKVLPQEHPGLRVGHVDVDDDDAVVEQLLAEVAAGLPEPIIALRGGQRFLETYEPAVLGAAAAPVGLPEHPVVLVTGGLGHMGVHLSDALFTRIGARLVLLGRTALPEPERWAAESEDPSVSPERQRLLRKLAQWRAQRDDVLVVNADMNDARQVYAAVDAAIARFGRVDLVVHGAARIDPGAFASIADTGPSVVEAQFSPKLRGMWHLMDAFRGREPRRWVLHSSISSVLGGLGLAVYSGANAVLDALALDQGPSWLSIDWDLWDNAGEAEAAGMPDPIVPPEGQEAFLRLLGADIGSRVLVVAKDLEGRLNAWVRHDTASPPPGSADRHPRPNLPTAFVEPRTATEQALAEIWAAQLGITPIGVHDRFFDLGGHSLLAVQVASEIRDKFQMEMPVLKLFQAPTVAELAVLVDHAGLSGGVEDPAPLTENTHDVPAATALEGDAPTAAAKASYRDFYNDVTRRLEQTGVGEASFFLNYGYISLGDGDQARFDVPDGTFNPSSVRLAFELLGDTDLGGLQVLDVGCGRGGTVALLADRFACDVTGVDLAPEAIAFCRRAHRLPGVRFEVGDSEHLPFDDASFDAVTNIESSHTYPRLRAFLAEVKRVLRTGGVFLYTDLLPVQRWDEVRAVLGPLRLSIVSERHITANVLASCDAVAATRAEAFGGGTEMINNFLAVPGSMVYEQMRVGAWEYRILRARRT
jgi:acyl transferase domain-containing protein/SAM-dependent methyltransferase